MSIIRKYFRVKSFDKSVRALLSSTVRLAAVRMEDLADVAIEELIRHKSGPEGGQLSTAKGKLSPCNMK